MTVTDHITFNGPAASVLMARDPGTQIVAAEVWDQDCYRLAGSVAGATLVDIGANVGVSALAAIAHGAARVVAVEPDAVNVEQLRLNVALSGAADRVEIHHCAVGRPGQAQVHRDRKHPDGCYGSSWTSPPLEPGARTIDQRLLEDFLPLAGDAILKIDTEGAEYEILAGTGVDVLAARVQRLVLEWHHFPGRGIDAFEQLPHLAGRLQRRYDVELVGAPQRGGLLFAQRRCV